MRYAVKSIGFIMCFSPSFLSKWLTMEPLTNKPSISFLALSSKSRIKLVELFIKDLRP
jgi:hypothetical protein